MTEWRYTIFSLTKNELEVICVLWEQDKPLSKTQIIELSPDRSWRTTTVHILLNSLLKKGAIHVDSFVKTGKNYGRTYAASITHEDYIAMQLKINMKIKESKPKLLLRVFASLINDDDVDGEVMQKLEELLNEKKKKRKNG
jgi:predicted transcriptional regulator